MFQPVRLAWGQAGLQLLQRAPGRLCKGGVPDLLDLPQAQNQGLQLIVAKAQRWQRRVLDQREPKPGRTVDQGAQPGQRVNIAVYGPGRDIQRVCQMPGCDRGCGGAQGLHQLKQTGGAGHDAG